MKTCTFFGHRDCPDDIENKLTQTICELIEKHGVNNFYVGKNGRFDELVLKVLRKLPYPIRYAVVLEKLLPSYDDTNYKEFIFPDELIGVHPKFAIDRRNNWMLSRSEYVICYVEFDFGGAAKFMRLAKNKKKTVINLFLTD